MVLSKDRQSGVGNSLRLPSIKTQFFYGKLGLDGETPAKPFDTYLCSIYSKYTTSKRREPIVNGVLLNNIQMAFPCKRSKEKVESLNLNGM